ncbi:MAG: hydrogenase expression/formation protein HypE [Candidatus Omnitrophica bacterium]|nr:hydrogenase expression/formation protein HypE [Candidatus Omnitrophota bacterium]
MKEKILISHGSGGRLMHSLIKDVLLKRFASPVLKQLEDSAVLKNVAGKYDLCFTTDSYTVTPLFFPGGDIGKLAVCGTINDLAVTGAEPLFLSCGIIAEEGLETETLKKIIKSMSETAKRANVEIVTGDFKVVERGKADGIFINTSGIGIRRKNIKISRDFIKPGDKVIINGVIGEHELAVLAARKKFGIKAGIKSDCAPLNGLIREILALSGRIRFMRDPTRGGTATTLNEIAEGLDVGILLYEKEIPVSAKVNSLCEILGFDPLYLANEGKIIVICGSKDADKILCVMKKHTLGKRAAVVGEVVREPKGKVIMETSIGSKRIVDMLSGTQLPRIC